MTPTERTLHYLKDKGYACDIVERFIPSKPFGFRRDLFNILDIIALTPDGVMGVQSCGSAHSEHMKTLTEIHKEESRRWLETPGTSLYLFGWRKLKNRRGMKAMHWEPRVRQITLEDLGDNHE